MPSSITSELHAALTRLAAGRWVSATEIRQLRDCFGEAASGRLLSAAALQKKARWKLGDGVWWVTERSLQQATPWQVARLKAKWFGNAPVYDLCCGIGGDALQFACRGEVIAVDADPEIASMAEANLNAAEPSKAARKGTGLMFANTGTIPTSPVVQCTDVRRMALPAGSAVHVDPDRRANAVRASQPDRYQPSWSEVWRMIEPSRGAAVKLAPAAELEDAFTAAGHRCWISLGGSVREQTLLLGSVADRAGVAVGSRSAVVCRGDASYLWCAPDPPLDQSAPVTTEPQAVLVDPDPAIRAAGLTDAFARDHQLQCLGGPSGFLTGAGFPHAAPGEHAGARTNDGENASGLAVSGRVLWCGSCDRRNLRRELRRLNVYPEVVKTRGTEHSPAELVRRLRDCGDRPVTLWLGRTGARAFAAVTEEVASG